MQASITAIFSRHDAISSKSTKIFSGLCKTASYWLDLALSKRPLPWLETSFMLMPKAMQPLSSSSQRRATLADTLQWCKRQAHVRAHSGGRALLRAKQPASRWTLRGGIQKGPAWGTHARANADAQAPDSWHETHASQGEASMRARASAEARFSLRCARRPLLLPALLPGVSQATCHKGHCLSISGLNIGLTHRCMRKTLA